MQDLTDPARDQTDRVRSLTRPHSSLLKYYILSSLLFGPLFPFVLTYHLFRYQTLTYQFDDEGVTMSWGALFRREISLTYTRIQDIHLVSNLMERWLGLARVQVQTAAGSATAEMTLEGLLEFEMVRDFLYSRMRGSRKIAAGPAAAASLDTGADDATVAALREAAAELRMIRESLASSEALPSGTLPSGTLPSGTLPSETLS